MATGLVLSIWRTFRYSRMASRYCSLLKYRSPRSRWRAFLASGDREHPATIRSAVSERTTDVRIILNISIRLLSQSGRYSARGAAADSRLLQTIFLEDTAFTRAVASSLTSLALTRRWVGKLIKCCAACSARGQEPGS